MSEQLLRPRSPHDAQDGPWTWTSARVQPPAAWRSRSRRARRSGSDRWRVRARSWTGPDQPRRSTPVVVVHGLIVASAMSAPVAARLALDGPVHAIDLPGCGRSDKPRPTLDVPELAEALTSWVREVVGSPPVLVGTSLGSQVVLEAAARHPQAFRGVVLVSPTVDRERRTWRSQLLRWQAEGATQSWRLRGHQVRDYARSGIPRAARTFAAALRHRPEERIADLDVPVLVVVGRRDPLIRTAWARDLAHLAPRGRLAVVPGAVHAMSHENPVELGRLVNGFVQHLDDEEEST